ncbi:protein-glutamate O-methyltransferase CheR [Aquabacterium sp.]|uniref:protein-glutamate O-methyltransferase CheR n=1 Tax=Aquabacterium sp. TaxID=1872578 RepID=UPI002C51975D|nr:protein-glutamate O-methyltransferase CheR [Aquabacterium sp.]HSW08806.1 protein-glutamate O-methyltransferase CheR [Aquabacterium sp.]
MSSAIAGPHVERFRALVARHLGLLFEPARSAWLTDVLRQRVASEGLDADRYLTRLQDTPTPAEVTSLAEQLTVAETYFFRNIEQFDALREIVLPERLRARAAQRSLRILSAACATGEEAYSVAISLRELPALASWQVTIQAVDINPVVIAKARRGRYADWALRETPPALQQRWFRREGNARVLDAGIVAAVQFDQHNLCDAHAALWRSGAWDIVFCRNLLMYLTPQHAQALVARIEHALVPGGTLFLGHAETLRGLSAGFHLRHTHGSFYYQRKDGADTPERMPPAIASLRGSEALALTADAGDDWVGTIGKAAERVRALSAQAAAPARAPAPRSPPLVSPLVPAPAPPRSASRPAEPADPHGRALELLGQERFAEALALVSALPVPASPDPDLLLLHAMLLLHCGQFTAAQQLCQRLLAIDDLHAGAHHVVALCREALGDLRGAADSDQCAIHLDPAFAMPRLHLGLLARRAGDRQAAMHELGQALQLLQRELPARLRLFGGGFQRDALIALCRAELAAAGGTL